MSNDELFYTDPVTGTEYQTYLFSYMHDGKKWGFEIMATSPEDAKERVRKLGLYGHYDGGPVVETIPAGPAVTLPLMTRLVSRYVRFRNRLKV